MMGPIALLRPLERGDALRILRAELVQQLQDAVLRSDRRLRGPRRAERGHRQVALPCFKRSARATRDARGGKEWKQTLLVLGKKL